MDTLFSAMQGDLAGRPGKRISARPPLIRQKDFFALNDDTGLEYRFLKPTKIYYSANLWSNPKIRVINRQFFTNWFSSKD
jgi:hypothetical protein